MRRPRPAGTPRQHGADDDSALVSRAQAGDRLAFEELVRRHAERLHAVVARLVADRHEAEEVTQEAFLRAWRGIAGFKGEARFFTWLYRIGVNEARRRAARRTPPGAVTSLDEHGVDPADPRSVPDRHAEHRDLRVALERAVRALDPDYRAPLILRDVEGLSTAEAAAIMGLSEAAFKSRLHRARLAVRNAVEDHLDEDDD
jgi:RNA polymerase sigma-70 factor (ECF subfamily)